MTDGMGVMEDWWTGDLKPELQQQWCAYRKPHPLPQVLLDTLPEKTGGRGWVAEIPKAGPAVKSDGYWPNQELIDFLREKCSKESETPPA